MQSQWIFRFVVLAVFATASSQVTSADQSTAVQGSVAQLKPLGTTYNRVQSADWIGEKRFAVGRWDGTITVFRPKSAPEEFGPVLLQPLATPARKGIELVANINGNFFITSNDSMSLVLWRRVGGTHKGKVVAYDSHYGTAVSASSVLCKAGTVVVVGHANGYLSFWCLKGCNFVLKNGVSIRSPKPIEWQWQTWHVRGIASYDDTKIVTVSEDGDICLISVPDGKVLDRKRYNPKAQRGINDVAVHGNLVFCLSWTLSVIDELEY